MAHAVQTSARESATHEAGVNIDGACAQADVGVYRTRHADRVQNAGNIRNGGGKHRPDRNGMGTANRYPGSASAS